MKTKMVALVAGVLLMTTVACQSRANGGSGAAQDNQAAAPTTAQAAEPGAGAQAGQAGAAADTSALHPPAGSRIALVVFEDLECPACAKADPLLVQAQHTYGVALVRHDFIIPSHPWSKEAHIMARFLDTQSPQLGEEFRQYIFANQPSIYKTNLRQWADQFAAAHHTAIPAFYDPSGAFKAKVEADTELGRATGIRQTPTIYVVTDSPQIPPQKVEDSSKLFETIEQVKSQLPPEPKGAKKSTAAKKK